MVPWRGRVLRNCAELQWGRIGPRASLGDLDRGFAARSTAPQGKWYEAFAMSVMRRNMSVGSERRRKTSAREKQDMFKGNCIHRFDMRDSITPSSYSVPSLPNRINHTQKPFRKRHVTPKCEVSKCTSLIATMRDSDNAGGEHMQNPKVGGEPS
jgi:hypothetical protein